MQQIERKIDCDIAGNSDQSYSVAAQAARMENYEK